MVFTQSQLTVQVGGTMKKGYVNFLKLYVLELIIGVLMDYYKVKIHITSDIVNGIVTLVIILPVVLFLYFAGQDKTLAEWKRYISKFFFGFLIFCYVGGAIVELIVHICK